MTSSIYIFASCLSTRKYAAFFIKLGETIIPITKFSYGVSQVRVVEGYIVDLVPQTVGSAKSFTVDPPLPFGSKINKENGYIEITYGAENTNFTVTVSNDVNSMTYTFSVILGNSAQEPVRFLKLGYYDQYEFAVGHPVDLPVFVTGPVTLCQMTEGEIPGLSFNINGLKGTPTTTSLVVQKLVFICRNEVTITNEFVIRAMVHSSDKPGLIANYWKWVRYTLAFPCRMRINPYITPGASLEVQKIATSITVNDDNYFNFYPDFESYYGAMYTGYIKIPADRSYVFSTQSATGSYIEIDDIVAVDHMQSCHGNSKATGSPLELTAGYHRITLGMNRKDKVAYARFFWKKDGVTEKEIEMSDLSHVPMNSISYEQPINAYQKNDKGVYFINNLLTYDVAITSCGVSPVKLPGGIKLSNNGSLQGIPTEITTFADYVYTVTCNTEKGEVSHQFSIEVRDFAYLPAVPYIMLKRATDRRVPVNPDMQFQLLWVIDHSCYPNRNDLYWKVTEAPDSISRVTCTGDGRKIDCKMHVITQHAFGGAFDPGPEYDQAFQLPGTALEYFEKSTYLLVASINNDPKRSAVLKFSYTCREVTPIPGWVYYGIWTVHYNGKTFNYMPDAPPGSDGRCCRFELYDRNNIEILSLPTGYPDWLMRQGLLLEPNEYTLNLYSLDRGNSNCRNGAYFNLTMDNKHELVNVPFLTSKVIKVVVRRMECASVVSDSGNLPTTSVGGTIKFACADNQFGERIRECRLDTSGAPFWAPEVSTCRSYIPITSFSYEVQYINLPINQKYKLTPTVEGDYDEFEFSSPPVGESKYDRETGVIEFMSSERVTEMQR